MSAPYSVLVPGATQHRLEAYLQALLAGTAKPGVRLEQKLMSRHGRPLEHDDDALTPRSLLQALFATKPTQIFAESHVAGDGSDWNAEELALLGDVSVAVPVTIFDDGKHSGPAFHDPPFEGELLYTPGALLRNGHGVTPADWAELVRGGVIDEPSYFKLYERRLMPVLLRASHRARSLGRRAFVTIPGLGCGQFAGPFRGTLGAMLGKVLFEMIERHAEELEGVAAVYYDPYNEGDCQRARFGNTDVLMRPLQRARSGRPQLCRPTDYAEGKDRWDDCMLFSVVAWDHVSWPGNDFWVGSRVTDDGVKAAATSSMAALTGVQGRYDRSQCAYLPPHGYENWRAVALNLGLELRVE